MDELLDVAEVVTDSGFEGAFAWILRLVGIVLVLAGIGVWLFAGVTLLVPAGLVVAGVVLVLVPELLGGLLEVA